jgi:nucleotide-binding universal stress UspA family protein
MRMFKRILVPIDGSGPSRAGLERAIALAKNQNARLRLLHVVDENGVVQGMEPAMNIGELLDSLVAEGRKILAAAVVTAKKHGVKADTVLFEVLIGRVADRIVREAAKWHADVIVMGTHGRRGIGRLVMGSDAENVLRQTPVPVLLVRSAKRRR